MVDILETNNIYDVNIKQIIVGYVGGKTETDSCANAEDLVENEVENTEYTPAACSVSLITYDSYVILVDCAACYETELLLNALKQYNVQPNDVTDLVLTHWHSDHTGNLNLFPNARLTSPTLQSVENLANLTTNIGPLVTIEYYAGHSECDLVVFVQQSVIGQSDGNKSIDNNNANKRSVVIAGDIFECINDIDGSWRDSSFEPNNQSIVRDLCVQRADIIIPGHGKAFFTNDYPQRPLSLSTSGNLTIHDLHNFEFIDKTNRERLHKIILIICDGVPILVNTGSTKEKENLLIAFSSFGIQPSQVRYVVITSVGLSTCGNLNLFTNAKVYMSGDISMPGSKYTAVENFCEITAGVGLIKSLTYEKTSQNSVVLSQVVKNETDDQKTSQTMFTLITENAIESLMMRCKYWLTSTDHFSDSSALAVIKTQYA